MSFIVWLEQANPSYTYFKDFQAKNVPAVVTAAQENATPEAQCKLIKESSFNKCVLNLILKIRTCSESILVRTLNNNYRLVLHLLLRILFDVLSS